MNSKDNNETDVSKMGGPETTLSLNENHPPPVPALELTVTPRHLVIGTTSHLSKTQCCASLIAIDLPTDDGKDARAPIDMVVALDVSYSIRGESYSDAKSPWLFSSSRFSPPIVWPGYILRYGRSRSTNSIFSQDQREDAIVLVNSLEVRETHQHFGRSVLGNANVAGSAMPECRTHCLPFDELYC